MMIRKKVFISYCSEDISKVRTLVKRVEKTNCLEAIVVEHNRDPMQYLSDKIVKSFNQASYIIPILTSNSIYTQYINQEIGYAMAKRIPIYPIVAQEIMYRLKGFVTSQNDLSYNFRSYPDNPKRERQVFRDCCDILLEDLVKHASKIKKTKSIGLSDVFNGLWQNRFEFPDGRTGVETFQIKENDRYYIGENFMFKLDKISISKNKRNITFRKNGVNDGDYRTAVNILTFKEPGIYVGDEEGNRVTYSKI